MFCLACLYICMFVCLRVCLFSYISQKLYVQTSQNVFLYMLFGPVAWFSAGWRHVFTKWSHWARIRDSGLFHPVYQVAAPGMKWLFMNAGMLLLLVCAINIWEIQIQITSEVLSVVLPLGWPHAKFHENLSTTCRDVAGEQIYRFSCMRHCLVVFF